MDPHAVLGVPEHATPAEVTSAYREAAKRWHPDIRTGDQAQLRMAEVNAAYELLRSDAWQKRRRRSTRGPAARAPGHWLDEATRRALGPELVAALRPDEPLVLVTPAATWASPHTLLALTQHRLLWLLDDVPVRRVRTLRFGDLAEVSDRLAWPRRRSAVLEIRTRTRRKLAWSELRPATARELTRHLRARTAG